MAALPFQKRSFGTARPAGRRVRRGAMFIALPLLAALTALSPKGVATSEAAPLDQMEAHFERCHGRNRITCVVDGDTLWLDGTKIRLADINTPEISQPACQSERALGEAATLRLLALLNEGPFSLEREARDEDRYGRKLRVVTRDGVSLGDHLAAEGLAEKWGGRRGDWCGASMQ